MAIGLHQEPQDAFAKLAFNDLFALTIGISDDLALFLIVD